MLFPQKMTGFSQILTGCSSHYSLWNERLQSILQNASIFKAPLNAVFVNNGCGSDAGRSWGVLCRGLVMSCFNWSWSPSLSPAHTETGTCQLCHPWASGIPRSSTVLEPVPSSVSLSRLILTYIFLPLPLPFVGFIGSLRLSAGWTPRQKGTVLIFGGGNAR